MKISKYLLSCLFVINYSFSNELKYTVEQFNNNNEHLTQFLNFSNNTVCLYAISSFQYIDLNKIDWVLNW